ncbi:Two-component response regulator [Nodularia spumigena CCY9414]|nr:Two-component response regulator [Nodularia spumigena CCY9414]
MLIDQDPIFRLGLRVALSALPDIQVVAEAETDTRALQILAELAQKNPNQVNLVVLELGNGRSISSQQNGLQLCQQLKIQYPQLPVLLLSSVQEPGLLLAVKAAGVNGYCPKGTPISQLVAAMEKVADGGSYWFLEQRRVEPTTYPMTPSPSLPLARVRKNWYLSGIGYIEAALAEVTAQLQTPGLPLIDRAVFAGQRRELLAARWLLTRLLVSPQEIQSEQPQESISATPKPPVISALSNAIVPLELQQQPTSPPLLSPRSLQSDLFSLCVTKLQSSLQNVTDVALEIDIFREDKKRELLYIVLQKLAQQLDELRLPQITIAQLESLKDSILYDLWQSAITDFFGKFYRVQVSNQNIEVVNLLLQNYRVIQTEIFNKIPLVVELFSYLVFQTDLHIDNTCYSAGSPEAKSQALIILENLLIQVANGVVQPLLNSLADVEEIKENYYDRKLISTREIERFRNELSWKYRLNKYINEPKAMFESSYELFVLAPRGIAKTSLYAPRSQELAQLSGIPLLVTLTLEFRDAIAPRLKSLLSVVGSSIVFLLTKIVGRGLGLIGRGILQGIGSVSFTEKNFKRHSERQK